MGQQYSLELAANHEWDAVNGVDFGGQVPNGTAVRPGAARGAVGAQQMQLGNYLPFDFLQFRHGRCF